MNYTHAGPSYGSKIFVWGVSCDASSTEFVSLGFCCTQNSYLSWGIYSFCLRDRCGAS